MQHTLVAGAGRARLVRVYSRNDQDPVADLILYTFEAVHVIQDGVRVIS